MTINGPRRTLLKRANICLCVVAVCLFDAFSVANAQKRPPSPVTVAPILYESVQNGQTFIGTVVPTKTAIIGSAVDGRVIDFLVNEGDRVEGEGEKSELAHLLTATINLELKNAEAELKLRIEEHKEVKKLTRDGEKEEALGIMEVAQAAWNLAEADYRRKEQLHERGAITKSEWEDVEARRLQAKGTFEAREGKYRSIVEDVESHPQRVAQAEARMEMQQHVVDKLKDQIRKYTIRSRFAGYVVTEFTEAGAWVNSGDPVVEIAALDEVDILVNVLESQIRHVNKGDTVRVDIPALYDPVLQGKIELIVPRADYKTRTFPVKVRVKNQTENDVPVIKAGMLARVTMPTGAKSESFLVQKDAIVLGGRTPAVYVVEGAKKAGDVGQVKLVPVKIGIAVDTFVSVQVDRLVDTKAEFTAGDFVVTRGNERLRPMQNVNVVTIDKTRPQGIDPPHNVTQSSP